MAGLGPTFARPRRVSPEQYRKHCSGRDYRLDERNRTSTVFSGIRTGIEGRISLVIAVLRQIEAPNSRQIDMIGFLTKLAEGVIIGRTDKSRERFAAN